MLSFALFCWSIARRSGCHATNGTYQWTWSCMLTENFQFYNAIGTHSITFDHEKARLQTGGGLFSTKIAILVLFIALFQCLAKDIT